MKLNILSENLITIINKTLENQDLVKLVNYNDVNPFIQPVVASPQSLIRVKVFPYPYSGTLTDEQTQIRVYYGKCDIDHIENTPVLWDIVTHNNLYLIKNSNNQNLLRPYEIAKRITQQFDKTPVGTVGVLNFKDAIPFTIDTNYQMIRLIANMTTLGK
jgi:hypothetical protein